MGQVLTNLPGSRDFLATDSPPSKRTGLPENGELSVVVITRNEAKNLPRLLASVRGLAGEIIVFDSGSTDDTVALAEAAGARVVDCEWKGWSATKNAANEAARGRWILSLDADEALDPVCVSAIRDHIEKGERNEKGTLRVGEINRLTRYGDQWVRHSGWHPDRKIRLWPNGAAHWEGAIHEIPVFDEDIEVCRIAGWVEHHSYPFRADHLEQIEKFGRVWAQDQHASGRSSGLALVIIKVAAQWIKTWLVKGGFLDGRTGWTIARLSAWATWRKHARLRDLNREPSPPPSRILVSRTDALGDLVLTLPLLSALRKRFPSAEIDLLVRPYAQAVATASKDVNQVLVWETEHARDVKGRGAELLRSGRYDAIVLAFPDASVLGACHRADIPIRVGTARRWHSFFRLTHRNWDGRKDSGGHEAWHGLRLLLPFGIDPHSDFREEATLVPPPLDAEVKSMLDEMGSPPILLHPGSHGSADNWPAERFAALALQLGERGQVVAFTGTEAEGEVFAPFLPQHRQVFSLFGQCTLTQLLALQARSKAMLASSTGPLHTAAALGTPTLGIYGVHPPQWSRRWSPIGPQVATVESGHRTKANAIDLTVDEVNAALQALMERSGAE